jgi:Domain of unknown function (DUF4124)
MRAVLVVLVLLALPAQAQVYRWIDDAGKVQYSNALPPPSANAKVIGAVANGGFLSAVAVERPAEIVTASVQPSAPPSAEPRGLDFRKYVSLQRGMSEGELFVIAGAPDLHTRDRSFSTYTYLPTVADPFITTIELVRGRISEIERVRRF